MKLGHALGRKLGRKRRARTIVAAGGSLTAVVASLLGGLALVVFALRDVDLRVRLTRRAREEGRGRA